MNARQLADQLAAPVGRLGAAFYFDPGTVAAGEALGLDAVAFYGLGRGGVLGDVTAEEVERVFVFFAPRAIERIWSRPRATHDPATTAASYLVAADDYARRAFATLDAGLARRLAAAAHAAADADAPGTHLLADGYARLGRAGDPVADAYRGVIRLRELRGALHAEALAEVGVAPLVACYLDSPAGFALHGYREEEAPAVTDEDRRAYERAEDRTSELVAERLGVLADDPAADLLAGVTAMADLLDAPR